MQIPFSLAVDQRSELATTILPRIRLTGPNTQSGTAFLMLVSRIPRRNRTKPAMVIAHFARRRGTTQVEPRVEVNAVPPKVDRLSRSGFR